MLASACSPPPDRGERAEPAARGGEDAESAREGAGPSEEELERSLALSRQTAAGSLAEAAAWQALGSFHLAGADLERAEKELRAALELRSRLAAGSLEHGESLQSLGTVAMSRGRYEEAGRLLEEALETARRQAPESPSEAKVRNSLGSLATRMGRLDEADGHLARAAEILERVDPRGEERVQVLINRAKVASSRGDLARSDQHLQAALALCGTPAAETLAVAQILYRLGRNATDRGDLEGAMELGRRALAIQRRLAPGTIHEASSLTSLSLLAVKLGRLDEAEETARGALAIRERTAPGSLSVAESLQILGLVEIERLDFEAASEHLRQAVEIARRQSPGSLHEASALCNLGFLSLRAGDWEQAEPPLRRASGLFHELAPGGTREADALVNLGDAYLGMQSFDRAEQAFAAAVDIFEAQMPRLGGTDASRASYLEPYLRFHQRLIDLQLSHGRAADALGTLERSRGRSLLMELARRDLAFAVPRVLSLDEIRASLDPGTAWLSFSVDHEKTLLFVVKPETERVEVFSIAAGLDALAEEVALFRGLIVDGRRPPRLGQEGGASAGLLAQARKLYALLLAPAEASLASAERLLISPDGALQVLPFAALARPGEPLGFLAQEWPVHYVLSATLYAELRRGGARAAPTDGRVVAFGDPRFRELQVRGSSATAPADHLANASLALDAPGETLRRYERGLPPIPGARAEVEALAALYPGSSRVFLGAAATERAVKTLPASPRYLHFATHALLDPLSPLDSALALAAPAGEDGGEDGLLHAWEIFEQLRLDADLVTLSACDSALGRGAAGEGLIGLARAFQHAGARSILASLWPVSDRSTAELMRRFYAALAAGRPKDEALAEAQRAFAAGEGVDPALAHPFYWAAFELIGDRSSGGAPAPR